MSAEPSGAGGHLRHLRLSHPHAVTGDLHIRAAQPNDGAALYDVHASAVRALDAYSESVKSRWLQLLSPEVYGDGSGELFRAVAEVRGQVAGFGEVDLRRALIVALYVHPDAAHGGVGSALLHHLEAKAREAGLRTIEVLSGLNAEGFYMRHGYKVVGMANKRVTSQFTVEGVQMEKKL